MFRTIRETEWRGRRVLVRSDFNVPITGGKITDDTRIAKGAQTIRYLLSHGCRQVIVLTHLGRPRGIQTEYSVRPVAQRLGEILGQQASFVHDCIDAPVPGARVVVLENVRFHPEEEENYEFFAKRLAKHADVYVNDAFGVCHRKHASIVKITEYLPAYAGLCLEREYSVLRGVFENPKRPFVAVVGGAKLQTKLALIDNLLKKVDRLLLGGAMIFTFYRARGYETGTSLCDEGSARMAQLLLHNEKLVLPVDVVVAKDENSDDTRTVSVQKMQKNDKGLDIGPATSSLYSDMLSGAGTVVWNGPLGYFEKKPFFEGTRRVAQAIAESGAKSVVGGGDTVRAVSEMGLEEKFYHVSTGGGATLTMMEGRALAGIKALLTNMKIFP